MSFIMKPLTHCFEAVFCKAKDNKFKQESPPAGNRTRHTTRGVTCHVGYPSPGQGGGGTPSQVWGAPESTWDQRPGKEPWTMVPLEKTWNQTPGKEPWTGYPQKGPGTRHLGKNLRMGYPLPGVD